MTNRFPMADREFGCAKGYNCRIFLFVQRYSSNLVFAFHLLRLFVFPLFAFSSSPLPYSSKLLFVPSVPWFSAEGLFVQITIRSNLFVPLIRLLFVSYSSPSVPGSSAEGARELFGSGFFGRILLVRFRGLRPNFENIIYAMCSLAL